MKFSLFRKKKNTTSSIYGLKSEVSSPSGLVQRIYLVKAKVVSVGDDEAEDGFSYKYVLTNPVTNELEEATDYLKTINKGEQLFEINDEVDVLFDTIDSTGHNYTVTRQMVFPKILKKKNLPRKIFKIFYTILLVVGGLICCLIGLAAFLAANPVP